MWRKRVCYFENCDNVRFDKSFGLVVQLFGKWLGLSYAQHVNVEKCVLPQWFVDFAQTIQCDYAAYDLDQMRPWVFEHNLSWSKWHCFCFFFFVILSSLVCFLLNRLLGELFSFYFSTSSFLFAFFFGFSKFESKSFNWTLLFFCFITFN